MVKGQGPISWRKAKKDIGLSGRQWTIWRKAMQRGRWAINRRDRMQLELIERQLAAETTNTNVDNSTSGQERADG
jgi:hypothetical protein